MVDMESDPEPRVRFRIADLPDAPFLTEFRSRTFRDTYAADTDAEDMEEFIASNYRHDLQEAELQDPGNLYLIAEVGGAPAGFALLSERPAEPGIPGDHPLMLAELYVDGPFLGTGVGSSLMSRCIEEGRRRGHDVLWLGVWERNPRAIAFYERWGFTEVGEMRFQFGKQTHRDVVLALQI